MKIVMAVILLSVICGCCTFEARKLPEIWPTIYPGVQYDILTISGNQPGLHGDMLPFPPIGIIDFPFSAAFDTICFPFDMIYWSKKWHSNTNAPSK